MSNKLPVIIQSIVYRMKGKSCEILLLKRNADRGGFWNVVNGTLELQESAVQCRTRELFEETGIRDVIHWSDEVHRFSFPYKNDIFVVIVFSAEVAEDQGVAINSEHAEYKWVSFDEALTLLKFDDDKAALQSFAKRLGEGQL